MSVKMATPGPLKVKLFWNKSCYAIISVYDVTNKIFSHDSNYIVNVVIWSKFGSSSISMGKVIVTSIFKDLASKTAFFEEWSLFKFNNLGLAPGTNLKFYASVAKGLKLNVRKVLGVIPTFAEVRGEKLVGRGQKGHPILKS